MNKVGVESQFKRYNLKPAKAIVRGIERLVIVDKKSTVQAIGPDMSYLEGADKSEICRVTEILIANVFDLIGNKGDQLLDESKGFSSVTPIKYCTKL